MHVLYETGLVASGYDLNSPKEFAARIYAMIENVTDDGSEDTYSGNGSSRQVVEPEVMEASSDPWRQ